MKNGAEIILQEKKSDFDEISISTPQVTNTVQNTNTKTDNANIEECGGLQMIKITDQMKIEETNVSLVSVFLHFRVRSTFIFFSIGVIFRFVSSMIIDDEFCVWSRNCR